MTNAVRVALAEPRNRGDRPARRSDGHRHGAPVSTDRSPIPPTSPRSALDGVAAGAYEVLADDTSRHVQAGLAKGVGALYPQLAE